MGKSFVERLRDPDEDFLSHLRMLARIIPLGLGFFIIDCLIDNYGHYKEFRNWNFSDSRSFAIVGIAVIFDNIHSVRDSENITRLRLE